MRVLLLTGGTGALGRQLLECLRAADDVEVVLLVRDPEALRVRELQHAYPRLRVVRGNVIHSESLGLDADTIAKLHATVTDIAHCAANTSFTAPLDEARAINVGGTAAVLSFARRCKRLERVVCASTAYVAGRRTGVIMETDAIAPDGHVNSYEQSKWEMERAVREAMGGLPVSICRFSTIIGHSKTGSVTGFNAIHHALRLFFRGLAPMVPGSLSTQVDLIPVDFAAPALRHLILNAFEPGQTYQLCAGAARSCTLDELLGVTQAVFEKTRPAWRKRRVERPAVVDLPTYALFVRSVEESGNMVLAQATRAVQAFAEQLAYPKSFDTTAADAALAGSGLSVPHVLDYYEKVVSYCVETGWGAGLEGKSAVATGRE